ncbi:hypothetical protein ACO0RG_003187 [Hanseniaspora osmophila]
MPPTGSQEAKNVNTDVEETAKQSPAGASFGLALPKKVTVPPTAAPAMQKSASSSSAKGSTKDKGSATASKTVSKTSKDAGTTNAPAATNKMGGSLMLAGIDVNEEEALLNEQNKKGGKNSTTANSKQANKAANIVKPPIKTPFLHPVHVAKHLARVIEEQKILKTTNGVPFDYAKSKPEILAQLSTACEFYMRDLITTALVASRHRRKTATKANSLQGSNSAQGQRSSVSKALRKVAQEEKKLEERRLLMRQSTGLEEKNTVQVKATNPEDNMAKASNATASLMTGGKKKYSWLTQSKKSSSSTFAGSNTATEVVNGPVATAIKSRGEMGIKYREPREEPGIVMRDFLRALENRRVNPSIDAVMTKGYSRIRD